MPGTTRWYDLSQKDKLGFRQALRDELEKAPNIVTGPYTLKAEDANRDVQVNSATPVTVTVPANVFAGGQKSRVVQTGAGQVTLAGGGGFTLNSPTTFKSAAQYATVTVAFTSATAGIVSGNIAAA